MTQHPLFQSFMIGGFECATQIMPGPRRVDLMAASFHDQLVAADYRALVACGIQTVRDGIRWHLIEPTPGTYTFANSMPQIQAARATRMQIIWDLCHYGWPTDLDVFSPTFIERYASLAYAFAKWLDHESDTVPFIAPINEISFLAWVAGEVGHFYPFALNRGMELKRQLVRAAIAGIQAIKQVIPWARIVHTDPLIHVVAATDQPAEFAAVYQAQQAQFQAWDMLSGRLAPELGGQPAYLDILGVNYYAHNQWLRDGTTIERTDPRYRPLRHLLQEVYTRYQRPLFIAETSSLGPAQPSWLRYVGSEVRIAQREGIPVHGLCLYPILDTPDWNDAAVIHQGLLTMPNAYGKRQIRPELLRELRRQQYWLCHMKHVYSKLHYVTSS